MIEKLLKKYPEGSDITIMNTMYLYGATDENGERICGDFIALVIKDNKTGQKDHVIIKNPKYTFYYLKPEYAKPTYNYLFIDKKYVDLVEVPYKNLAKEIAKITDHMADYNDAIDKNNPAHPGRVDREALNKLHTDTRLFNSDQAIDNHYRFEFQKYYPNNIGKLHKAFFDIETDIKYIGNNFPDPAEALAPVNAISFHDELANVSISFLLRNPDNPLVGQLEQEYKNGTFNTEYIHNFVEKTLGYKKMKRMGLQDTVFVPMWFDDELTMISTFFECVHKYNPDFIEGWNSSGFDLYYLITRIQVLGGFPAGVMSDHNWEFPFLKHFIDNRHKNELPERGDYTYIAGDTVWIDQMIQFASRRKAKYGSFTSFKLDDIGELTAGIHKLDYSHITSNIGELPWLDYKTFVLYNIMDTIVQKGIEQKTTDLEYLFAKCIVNATNYPKGHRQTVYLINRMTKEWDKLGYIIGNNCNKWTDEPDKFQGALVGDPLKTSDKHKIKIGNDATMIANNLVDFDFSSLYPSCILEYNIAPNTQLGFIRIPNKVYDNENAYHEDKYVRSGEYLDNYACDNVVEFCKRWLHLAGFKEFLEDWQEYNQKFHYTDIVTDPTGKQVIDNKLISCPVVHISKKDKKQGLVFLCRTKMGVIYYSDLKTNGVDINELSKSRPDQLY